MSLPGVYLLKIGYSNSIVIENGSRSVLVDTGVHGFMHDFQKHFKRIGIQFSDIKLIVLTHTHYDHTGNLKEIHKATGAKVAVNINEYNNLKNGFTPIPPGITPITKVIAGIGRILFPGFTSPPPFEAEIVVDNEFDLSDFGIEGKIIPTPGHTKGSQSVLLNNSLIAGDTFINIQSGLVFPHFVENPLQLLQTWQLLFDMGIEQIYPGHGAKFSIDAANRDYARWSKILKNKVQN